MSDSTHQLERLKAAYEASGDLAYDWDLAGDGISWLGGDPAVPGVASFDKIPNGETFHERIHPDDVTARMAALSSLYKGEKNLRM
jgi:hypothetical protein